jgi:hypothetical protein
LAHALRIMNQPRGCRRDRLTSRRRSPLKPASGQRFSTGHLFRRPPDDNLSAGNPSARANAHLPRNGAAVSR